MDITGGQFPTMPEDKALTILRRKFLVGIPLFSGCGYLGARIVSERYQFTKWASRLSRIGGGIITPIIGTMMIVHFNRAEIFRIGSGMMKGLDEARKAQVGPFADPSMREKWDNQVMKDRQLGRLFINDSQIDQDEELRPRIDYKSVVNQVTESSSSFRP